VDKVVAPVHAEMAQVHALLQQAHLEREEDRRDMASLWPDDHLMPTLLLKYKVGVAQEGRGVVQSAGLAAAWPCCAPGFVMMMVI
jgi:hypothetical protein